MKYQSARSSATKLVARGMEGRIPTMKSGVGKLVAASFLGKIKHLNDLLSILVYLASVVYLSKGSNVRDSVFLALMPQIC